MVKLGNIAVKMQTDGRHAHQNCDLSIIKNTCIKIVISLDLMCRTIKLGNIAVKKRTGGRNAHQNCD